MCEFKKNSENAVAVVIAAVVSSVEVLYVKGFSNEIKKFPGIIPGEHQSIKDNISWHIVMYVCTQLLLLCNGIISSLQLA